MFFVKKIFRLESTLLFCWEVTKCFTAVSVSYKHRWNEAVLLNLCHFMVKLYIPGPCITLPATTHIITLTLTLTLTILTINPLTLLTQLTY